MQFSVPLTKDEHHLVDLMVEWCTSNIPTGEWKITNALGTVKFGFTEFQYEMHFMQKFWGKEFEDVPY